MSAPSISPGPARRPRSVGAAGPEVRPETPSTDLRRPCGPSPGSATALLAHASTRCARCAARRFTRIWTTWFAESLAEGFRPHLSQAHVQQCREAQLETG